MTPAIPATNGAAAAYPQHPLRGVVLSEIHARPFQVIRTPRLLLHFAFMTDAAAAAAARADLAARCLRLGAQPPEAEARHHVVEIGDGTLRWETHAEFTTYSWDRPWEPGRNLGPRALAAVLGEDFEPPGPLMVATRLDLVDDPRPIDELLAGLDPGSIAVSSVRGGRAFAATDFQPGEDGMTGIVVIDRGLAPTETGALVQRLIEIETYRTLALLGLPEARRLQPALVRIAGGLETVTHLIGDKSGLQTDRRLLDDLTRLAAELEADATASAYRFGATRAYAEIVRQRFGSIREAPVEGYSRWSSFLERRMAPALRTCQTVEARQVELSQRLARSADLLRTRIEVELEEQNRELLSSMNQRARMQLRLQQTVEGLSVAAVSYYVVGLIGYLAKGADHLDIGLDAIWIQALAVPPVMLVIWLLVRRIRRRHGGEDHG